MTAIDITADRYLRSLSEAAAADSTAALATRGDIVRLAERQGVTVAVAAQAVLEATGTWPAVRRFRLLNYLKAGLVAVADAARCGWTADLVRPGDQDLHILALQAGTGRLLASATLRRPPASASARLADRDRPLLLVEETFGIGAYDCMPAVAQHEDDIPSNMRGLDRCIRYSQHFADIERMKRELTLQLDALRGGPTPERAPTPWKVGPSAVAAPASVVAVNREFATVKTDDGRLGFLRNGDVEYSRFIPDITRWYKVGDRLDGAFLADMERGEARHTLLAGKSNPWPMLASRYPAGTTFHGTIQRAAGDVGLFVRVDGEVNGLIPQSTIARPVPAVGARVEVTVTRIDSSKRRITYGSTTQATLRSRATSSSASAHTPQSPASNPSRTANAASCCSASPTGSALACCRLST